MRRPDGVKHRSWDDPFWHALRLLLDQRRVTTLEEHEVLPWLRATPHAPSAGGLATWLESREPELIRDLARYTHTRWDLAKFAQAELMRSEEEAREDFASMSSRTVLTYGTQQAHHQSSKVLVQTVGVIAHQASLGRQVPDTDPQARAAHLANGHIWVSPRRLDGALPGLLNPVGMWEIKEYWGKTSGGSKMSDAIYELQLVGTELAIQEQISGVHIEHIAIMDGAAQWKARAADLRRAIDLLYCGLLDELIIGREVMTDWEPAVARMWAMVDARGR